MLKGRVRKTKTGLIKIFIRLKTQAAITAVERVSTLMPGTNCEASRMATVIISHLVIITIITLPHYSKSKYY
jgi:multisubunit Na+/H+ antiporter MnhE subunit